MGFTHLKPGFLTAAAHHTGSTGVSLAMVAAAAGCCCSIVMPDDAAIEKSQLLSALGAKVERVRPVSITHPGHFVNVARQVRQLRLPLLHNLSKRSYLVVLTLHMTTFLCRNLHDELRLQHSTARSTECATAS